MARERPEEQDFTFRLRGHGQDIDAGRYRAENEKKAFAEALKNCKRFELPGWQLVCVETGTAQAAALVITPGGEKQRI